MLVGAGIEHVRIDPGNTASTPLDFINYPYSHSLVMLIVWGVLFGWQCLRLRQGFGGQGIPDARLFAVIFALVVSHWVLDVITHRPDMPLYPGGPKFGLGLWNSVPGTMAVEITMYAIGLWIYVRANKARDRIGRWAFIGVAGFLFVGFLASSSSVPPSVTMIWTSALVLGALTLALAHWADRHRTSSHKGLRAQG